MPDTRRGREGGGLSRRGLLTGGAGLAALTALGAAEGRLLLAGMRRAAAPHSHRLPGLGATALASGATGASGATSSAPVRIFLAPDDHTDYLWAADEGEYRRAFLGMLDAQLNLIDATADLPDEHQARWSCDGSLWAWEYERHRGPAAFERLVGRIRDGHVSVPLNPVVGCAGGAPAEAILRGLYYAGRLERRHDLRLPLVVATGGHTLPFGLTSLWAGAGARYAWKGVCGCDTRVPALDDREHEIYWWVGPDGRRLLTKWYSWIGGAGRAGIGDSGPGGVGGYAEARDPEAAVRAVTEEAVSNGFLARHPYPIIGLFGQGGDDLETYGDATIRAAIELSDERRTISISNTVDFFEAFEAAHGDTLPRVSASFGNDWDLHSASMQAVSARVRRATDRLREAEALAALEALADPGFASTDVGARDEAYMGLGLYYEHRWGGGGAVGHDRRREWQRGLADRVESYVEALHTRGREALGARISTARTSVSGVGDPPLEPAVRVFAFNPLGWDRDDIADVAWSAIAGSEDAGPGAVHVVDAASGRIVPSQTVIRDGAAYLRIWAEGVQAVGYRVFEIRPGTGPSWPNAAALSSGALVNDHYQIELSPHGSIDRLLDRARGNRDLVREFDGGRMNDLGPRPATAPAGAGRITIESAGPVSVTLRADVSDPIRRVTRITLDRLGRRIRIENELFGPLDATLTWDFGFDLAAFTAWHEEVGAVAQARLRADGGHYSERNARYDWLSLGHFVALADETRCATLSSRDCAFFRLGASTTGALDAATPRVSALAGGQVDGPGRGIPAQGGDERFIYDFALRLDESFSATESMRFALEHQTPLVTGRVTGRTVEGPSWPPDRFGLLRVEPADALLWALKPADDGPEHGLVARLWNVSNRRVEADLAFAPPRTIGASQRATHVETPIGPAEVRDGRLIAPLEAGAMETFVLRPARLVVGEGRAIGLPWVGR